MWTRHILDIKKCVREIIMRFCDFREKEVINICDCQRLGHVSDWIFDECSGCIEAIIVPRGNPFCELFGCTGNRKNATGTICNRTEYVIPYKCIKKIGKDIILVEIHEETK